MNACFPLKRILFVIIVTLTFGFKCSAAELPHISRSDRLNGWKTLRDFEELFKDRKASVVEILENGNQIGLGTVVSDDGYIVTKASEFGESLEVRLFDYSKHVPAVVSVDIKNDFALLKIDVKDLNPVEWSDPSIAKMGEWVMSPHEDETQVRIGVISATSRPVYEQPGALGVKLVDGNEFLMEDDLLDVLGLVNKINSGVRPIDKWLKNELSDTLKSIMKEDLTENSNKASFRDALLPDLNSLIFERSFYQEDRFNGIDLNPETTKVISSERRSIRRSVLNRMLLVDAYGSELASGKKGAIIFEVIKDSAADKAGLNAGDLILSLESSDVNGSTDLTRQVKQHKAGDTIRLTGTRGSEEWEKQVTLGYFDSTFPDQDVNIALSGEISDRRTGFDEVIQHDIPLPPKAMGGPLVTLDGKVIGINIARYDRVATFALPSSLVKTLIEKLK